jgi:hypothetical protein
MKAEHIKNTDLYKFALSDFQTGKFMIARGTDQKVEMTKKSNLIPSKNARKLTFLSLK